MLQASGQASRGAGNHPAAGRNSLVALGRKACVTTFCAGEQTGPQGKPITIMMGEETFHPDTRALLAYGRTLAGSTAAPPKKHGRADQVLERLFVIERAKDGRWPIRTFGADLVKVFGQDLKEHDFARFWLAPDLRLLSALIEACAAANEPGIARVTAETGDGRYLGAEILFTPLKVEQAMGERYLGLFQSLGGHPFLSTQQIVRLRLGSLHPPLAKTPKGVRLVVSND
jgi:hypothetical protein